LNGPPCPVCRHTHSGDTTGNKTGHGHGTADLQGGHSTVLVDQCEQSIVGVFTPTQLDLPINIPPGCGSCRQQIK